MPLKKLFAKHKIWHNHQIWQIALITSIIIVATILRVDRIKTQAILFADAASDILTAIEAVDRKRLPLLGIASSVPRFKQGPIHVWLVMLIYQLFGFNLLTLSIIYASLGIMAIIGLYYLVSTRINQPTALIACALLAVSPLAVAHSRMIYHTTAIPLAIVIYLYSLSRLYQQKKSALFLAVLSWTLNFQLELNLFPLILLIPYVLYKSQQKLTAKDYLKISSSLLIGLWPQIVYDLKNNFSQLVAFNVWIFYRIAAFFIPSEHNFSQEKLIQTSKNFWLYGQRIFSADQLISSLIFILLLIIASRQIIKAIQKKQLNFLIEINLISGALLSLAYLIKGYPAEAYFPPFFICLPLVIAYGLNLTSKKLKIISVTLLLCLLLLNLQSIYRFNFFVSNQQAFNYGPSLTEQRQIINKIGQISLGIFQLTSLNEAQQFPSYLDHYRLIAKEQGLKENHIFGKKFYFENKNLDQSQKQYFKNYQHLEFNQQDVYYQL